MAKKKPAKKVVIRTSQEGWFNELAKNPAGRFRIGADGWKILRCINTDEGITAAKACELVRDMLAGRPYKVPDYVVTDRVRPLP